MIERVALSVKGMHCDHCVDSVTKALKGLDGVKLAKVSLGEEKAQVTYDSDKVSMADMISAIKAVGYDAYDAQS
ncbi:MAG: copper ion binding protein [Firmicutes bacterium]|nr:copper ion binding protein [Bacillota bacterium]